MRARWLLMLLAASAVAGCAWAGRSTPVAPTHVFAHRFTDGHVALYWNCRQEAGLLTFEGIAQNPWEAQPIRLLEFGLIGADAQDWTISMAAGAARDFQILTNQMTPYRLNLRLAGEDARFDLYYRYQFLEGEEMGARLAGAPVPGPRLLAQATGSALLDACAEGKHPAR